MSVGIFRRLRRRILCRLAWRAGPLRALWMQSFSSTKGGVSEFGGAAMNARRRWLTFVIFSMLRTDLRRSSSSRRVAMFLAPAGAEGEA